MNDFSIRITHRSGQDCNPAETIVELGGATAPTPEPAILSTELLSWPAAIAMGYTKILADGTRVPGTDPRIDHVAVIDHAADLMWCVESLGDPDNEDDGIRQEHCIERCKQLRLLDFRDWRLSTRRELTNLIDDTRREPAIDIALFPRVKPRLHWTSTPAAWSSASAWFVYFGYGGVNDNHRNVNGFALAVRRAGQ